MNISDSQEMTPALYSIVAYFNYPLIDKEWPRIIDILRRESDAYEMAGLVLRDLREKLNQGALSNDVVLGLWKLKLGRNGEFDPFESKVLERITDYYHMIVELLEPPPPPLPPHTSAVEKWRENFEVSIQRRRDEMKGWIAAQSGGR